MPRQTITDLTTNDRVYIQYEDEEGFSIQPSEAVVLARDLLGHAMALLAPEFRCRVDISMEWEESA